MGDVCLLPTMARHVTVMARTDSQSDTHAVGHMMQAEELLGGLQRKVDRQVSKSMLTLSQAESELQVCPPFFHTPPPTWSKQSTSWAYSKSVSKC